MALHRADRPFSLYPETGTLYTANEAEAVIAIRAPDGAIRWKAQIEGVEVQMTVVQ